MREYQHRGGWRLPPAHAPSARTRTEAGTRMQLSGSTRWWTVTLALTAVRAGLAAWVPLGDDEGYYWVWSRHLAAGYYEHPPLVAWLVAGSAHLFGVSLLAIRLPFVIAGTLCAVTLRALVRETTGDPRLAETSSLVAQVVPVFLGLGFLVIPDAPLLLFWLLACRAFWNMAHARGRGSSLLLGLALGGALLSKYVAALALVSAAGYALARRECGLLRGFPAACGVAALVFAPVLGWNATHGWASFRYQFLTRHDAPGFDLVRLGMFLGSQWLYLSPLLFVFVAAAGLRVGPWKPGPGARGERFLWWLGAPTAAVFLATAAFTDFKPNWPAPAYLTLIPLSLLGLERWRARALRLATWIGRITVALAVTFALVPAIHLLHPIVRLPRGADPTADMRGWPRIADQVRRALADLGPGAEAGGPFIAAGRYALASRLEFYLPGHPTTVCLNPGRDAYDDWQRLDDLRGRDFVFVASDRFPTPPQRLVAVDSSWIFTRVRTSSEAQETFGVTIYQCRGFRPADPIARFGSPRGLGSIRAAATRAHAGRPPGACLVRVLPIVHAGTRPRRSPAGAGWEEPRHEEFTPRRAWSLFNAFTEVQKGGSPRFQMEGSLRLTKPFRRELQPN